MKTPSRDAAPSYSVAPSCSEASEPSLYDLEILVARAERCLACTATPFPDGARCYEFTPGGVEVCADLLWWNGKPVLPETLRRWREMLISYQAVPHLPDD